MSQRELVAIPGTGATVEIERDGAGRLRRLSGAGRVYVRDDGHERVYDEGFVVVREVAAPRGLLRHVRTAHGAWSESYLDAPDGRPEIVDGVVIERDVEGRIVACTSSEERWRYGYADGFLCAIDAPGGRRSIVRDDLGRPLAVVLDGVEVAIEHAGDRRADVPALPAGGYIDGRGRRWTTTGPDGSIVALYLWDGFCCLARVDGGPGEPLAAVFSLDGTGTPVRIITRHGVTRVARDAFGEGLLAHAGAPGLFGGAQHGGHVHLGGRSLDPSLGSWDAPDPWHGGPQDPRRANGYAGRLLVERPSAGRYAVCGHDPVTYADPTGNLAWYYVLSSLTWALPNNALSWVGIELTLNFWGSLFGGEIARYFDGAHIHSDRYDVGALQLDGAFGVEHQVFTTQHIVWAPREQFENHNVVSAFVPTGPIMPRYYGTVLRVVPAGDHDPLLLRGSRSDSIGTDDGPLEWARGGGTAEMFAPGVLSPYFPRGGFHVQIVDDKDPAFPKIPIRGPKTAVLTELEPGDTFATGTLDNKLTIRVAGTDLGIADGALVLVSNAGDVADIVTALSVEEMGGATVIRLATLALQAGTSDLRLRGLGAVRSSEVLARGAAGTHLSVTAANAPYQRQDALRLLDAATVVGSALVAGFEARIGLDAPLPGTLRSPIGVFATVPSGPARGGELTADPSVLRFPSGPLPAVGDVITVTRAGTTLAVAVAASGPDPAVERRVDRSLAALGAAGAVSWQAHVRGGALGARAEAVDAGSELTYVPSARGTAPAAGFVGIEDVDGTVTARAVTGVVHDVLVLATALPGTAAQYTVERYVAEPPDRSGLSAVSDVVLALNGNVAGGAALRLLQLGGPTLGSAVGASVADGFSMAGRVASRVLDGPGSTPIVLKFSAADAVVLRGGTSDELAVVRSIELTLGLDRDVLLDATGLRLVALAADGATYDAVPLGPHEVVVASTVDGFRAHMPRFQVGEVVQVLELGTVAPTWLFRIGAVAGTRLTLEGERDLPGAGKPLTVQRMMPADPQTGGPYIGIDGTAVHPAADGTTRTVRFSFWDNLRPTSLTSVGLVSAGRTLPAVVASTAYHATQPNAAASPMRLAVQPSAGGPAVATAAPRFDVGETVAVVWTGAPATLRPFVVTAVSGNVLDVAPLSGGPAVPGAVTNLTVRRLPVLDVAFTTTPAATGSNVELRLLQVAAHAIVPSFRRESGSALTFEAPGGGFVSPSANLVVAIPYVETSLRTDGTLTSGTVHAPDSPEHWVYDRRQALVEHELRHTQQYLWFGPLWWAAFPTWILDTVLALATEVERPAFSPFVAASLARDPNANTITLTIPNRDGIPFAPADAVQIYKGSEHAEVKLGEAVGSGFQIGGRVSVVDGDVFVRRHATEHELGTKVVLSILGALTSGRVMDLALTLTWGSAYQLVGRLGYLISRLVDSGTLLDASIEDGGSAARLTDVSKVGVLRNEQRVIVRLADIVVERGVVGTIQDGRITLDAPLALSAERDVRVNGANTSQPPDDWPKADIGSSGTSVVLKERSQAAQLAGAQRILVRVQGDTTVVRSVKNVADGGTITFQPALPASSGNVKVAPYATHTPGTLWHWNKYYPATVDPERRASVTLQPVEGDRLAVLPRDRVRVLYDENNGFGFTTTVTAVNGDHVDLEEAMPTLPSADVGEIIVRLAKIGRNDPTGGAEQFLIDDLYDAGWVRWITDPFSQAHFSVQQKNGGTFADVAARVGRYLLGSSAWSVFPPGFGVLMWDRVFKKEHLAWIEQDASEHSGDLYTSIGRLYGPHVVGGTGPNPTMTVGDIGQYWFWPGDRWIVIPRATSSSAGQDAPGVRLPDKLVGMPYVTGEASAEVPNHGAASGPFAAGTSEPGSALADPFFRKNDADPRKVPPATSGAFHVQPRGWLPMDPAVQRTIASYVAFSRPTGAARHRMTIRGGDSFASANDREAHDAGAQTLFHNIHVDDVAVSANGVPVAEGAVLTLLQTQRLRIRVTPNNERRYRATVMRPADGPSLRLADDLVLQARTVSTGTPEPVEISRYYRYDPASGQFESGGLKEHGVHLPTDIDVAVRLLDAAVVAGPPVVAALPATPDFSTYGGPIAPLDPGAAVFVLVAANVLVPGPVAVEYAQPAPPGTIDPVIALTDANAAASQPLRTFLGDGRAFRLALAADDPPEQAAGVRFGVTVGEPGNQATLSVLVPIAGHFFAATPGAFSIPRGGTLVLGCADLGGVPVTPLATIGVTMTDGTAPPLVGAAPELTFTVAGPQLTIAAHAAASTGRRRLLITDSTNPNHRARRTVEIV